MVITTIIMEEFSGGPWTKAVQGPKNFKIFISGFYKATYKLNLGVSRCFQWNIRLGMSQPHRFDSHHR